MIEQIITQYVANDGKVFEDKNDCINYEYFLTISCEEVQKYVNTFFKNEGDDYNCQNVEHSFSPWTKSPEFRLFIGWKGSEWELDEDFDIDWDKWSQFEEDFEKKFKVPLNMPSGYWGK